MVTLSSSALGWNKRWGFFGRMNDHCVAASESKMRRFVLKSDVFVERLNEMAWVFIYWCER
jgi:hypothetical protein